jgi:hypothetical protein
VKRMKYGIDLKMKSEMPAQAHQGKLKK